MVIMKMEEERSLSSLEHLFQPKEKFPAALEMSGSTGTFTSEFSYATWELELELELEDVSKGCQEIKPIKHMREVLEEEKEEDTKNGFACKASLRHSRTRGSILKRTTSEPMYLNSSPRAWKTLPTPNLERRRRHTVSLPLEDQSTSPKRRCNSSVEFSSIHIRSYNQTIGDNPSVSYGPPIQLDWEYQEYEPIGINEFKVNRGSRRNFRRMILSCHHRRNVLSWQYGCTEEELKMAEMEANRTKKQRAITIAFLPAMKVEAALESAWRKANRILNRGR
jgi:hypothetical protein